MKVCLLGYNEKFYWEGSATLKVQRNVHKYLNLAEVDCSLFTCSENQKFFSILFEPLTFKKSDHGRVISGGVVPFLNHLLKEKYDLLHMIVNRNYMVFILLFRFLFKAKFVLTVHDTLDFQLLNLDSFNQKKSYFVKRLLVRFSDLILIYNLIDLELLKRKYPKKNFSLIKNGVESELTNLNNDGKNRSIVLFAGGKDNSYKGLNFLISSLNKTNTKPRLIKCGYARRKNYSQNDFGELAPKEFFNMLIKVSILIVPSKYDSFSITALEAMSVGTPVILTENCGVSKYLSNGEGCFIVKYGDEESLSEKIDLLVSDSVVWNDLSTKAKITAMNFLWSKIIKDYVNQYSSLIIR